MIPQWARQGLLSHSLHTLIHAEQSDWVGVGQEGGKKREGGRERCSLGHNHGRLLLNEGKSPHPVSMAQRCQAHQWPTPSIPNMQHGDLGPAIVEGSRQGRRVLLFLTSGLWPQSFPREACEVLFSLWVSSFSLKLQESTGLISGHPHHDIWGHKEALPLLSAVSQGPGAHIQRATRVVPSTFNPFLSNLLSSGQSHGVTTSKLSQGTFTALRRGKYPRCRK